MRDALHHGEAAARKALRAGSPDEREKALERARGLARQIEYLTWPDRAKCLDAFLLAEAGVRLDADGWTAVLNRHPAVFRDGHPARRYAGHCGAMLAAVLLLLDEPPALRCVEQAFTWLLARCPELQEAAVAWIAGHPGIPLQARLERLPGYAFFFLTAFPGDSAESFLARDAFWKTMLGRD